MLIARLTKSEAPLAEDVLHQRDPSKVDTTFLELARVLLTRPLRMFLEPLVLFTDLFLLYQYSILFLYFEAYPFIFKGRVRKAHRVAGSAYTICWKGTYSMSSGQAACMLLPSKSYGCSDRSSAKRRVGSWGGRFHRGARVLHVRQLPESEQDGGQSMGPERRISAPATRLRRWTTVCHIPILAGEQTRPPPPPHETK